MTTTVQIPPLGESITQAVLVKWHKQEGQSIAKDEPLCELETDKANVDVPATAAGVVHLRVKEGDTVSIGQDIATIDEAPSASPAPEPPAPPPSQTQAPQPTQPAATSAGTAGPAARRTAAENQIAPESVTGTGKGGRITKQDMLTAVARHQAVQATAERDQTSEPSRVMPRESPKSSAIPEPLSVSGLPRPPVVSPAADAAGTRREGMSKIRRKIAQRLVQAQQTAAILTTFNEVDMTAVQDLRAKYKDRFTEVYGVGLGFMSFFVKATAQALREFPHVNAFIDGGDILYHDFVHMGIAVSTDRGLAVPVLRNAHLISFGSIEQEIRRLATAARDGKLALEELSGGTFTITNGGVFGSLLSTPILNPPQSAILGMHTIQRRPVAVGDKIEIRPMMYLALSYDHRLIDGKESVSFLLRLKQLLEDPARLILEV